MGFNILIKSFNYSYFKYRIIRSVKRLFYNTLVTNLSLRLRFKLYDPSRTMSLKALAIKERFSSSISFSSNIEHSAKDKRGGAGGVIRYGSWPVIWQWSKSQQHQLSATCRGVGREEAWERFARAPRRVERVAHQRRAPQESVPWSLEKRQRQVMRAGSGRVWESRARCESPSQQATTMGPRYTSFSFSPRCVRTYSVRKNAETRQKHYKWDASVVRRV